MSSNQTNNTTPSPNPYQQYQEAGQDPNQQQQPQAGQYQQQQQQQQQQPQAPQYYQQGQQGQQPQYPSNQGQQQQNYPQGQQQQQHGPPPQQQQQYPMQPTNYGQQSQYSQNPQQQQQQQYNTGTASPPFQQQGGPGSSPPPGSNFAGAPIRAGANGNGSQQGMGSPHSSFGQLPPSNQQQQQQQQQGMGLSPMQQAMMGAQQGMGQPMGSGSCPVSPFDGASGPRGPGGPGQSQACTGQSTRVCRHFVQGKCTWGDGCRFLHDASKITESCPPLSPPAPPPMPGMMGGIPPPIQVGQGMGVLSVNSVPHVGGPARTYSNENCIPPALQNGGSSSNHSTPQHQAQGPFIDHNGVPQSGSFTGEPQLQESYEPNVVVRTRTTSKPPSRPLSPGRAADGAGGQAPRYAHNPYGSHPTSPSGPTMQSS